jgi:Rrf2 family cysteine metabolism transcriptional repressor
MRISAKGEYAAKAVLYLSLRYPGVVTIHEVAEGHHIPLKYLEQILLALKKSGLLESRRGVHGGYTLARPPERISVGEVLRAVDGEFSRTTCLRDPSDNHYACPEGSACGLRRLWERLQENVDRVLFETDFGEVCRRTMDGRAVLNEPTHDLTTGK